MSLEEDIARLQERQASNAEASQAGFTALSVNMADGFQRVSHRLDVLNGSVASNTKWRYQHQQEHAHDEGVKDGVRSLRTRDIAILGAIITIMNVAAPYIRLAIEYMAKGGQ